MPERVHPTISEEIVRYLASRPHAADSVHGIAAWWLQRQRFEDSVAQVQQALDELEAKGMVIAVRVGQETVVYRPGPALTPPSPRQ